MEHKTLIYRLFPFVLWLPELRRWQVLRADIVAGVTVALILIPQSMAYAKLADLPPVYGLYAAFLPPIIAVLFGSSRHLVTGPVATASLISAATLQATALGDPSVYIAHSILLALLVGLLRLALGILRLGMLVNLLSNPVLVGFTNAAALIICTSQLHYLFGVEIDKGHYHFQTMQHLVIAVADQTHWPTVGMAALAAAILLFLRYKFKKLPHLLFAVVLTTLVSWLTGFDGKVVGEIPQGLPAFTVPAVDLAILPHLLTGAIVLTLIGLTESMSIAKTIAARTRQHIDVNQELIGQGLANLVGSFFQSYSVSASFARSAVNYASGAVTGFSSIVCSLVVVLTLIFLTPLLYYLPLATLAVIIVGALLGLIRLEPIVTAWRVTPYDGLIAVITFLCTLVLAPQLHWGILVGVFLSVALYLYRTMRPRVAYLARHGDGTLRDADIYGLKLDLRIALMRFDGRLYFGASSYFEDKVLEAVARLPELRYIVIDAGGINHIDASGEQILRQVIERLRAGGLDMYFSRVKPQIIEVLERTGAIDYIGRDHFFPWNQHALEHLWEQMEPNYKARCPLNVATPDTKEGAWSI